MAIHEISVSDTIGVGESVSAADIPEPVAPPIDPKDQALARKVEAGFEHAHEEELAKEEIEDRRQDRRERKEYARKIFVLICGWLIGIAVILLCSGFGVFGFAFSDGVLIALISGTTVNVLGLFIIVANYLFPKRPNR